MYTYMYLYITKVYTFICMHIYTNVCICIHIHTYVHMYIHVYIYIHTHVYITNDLNYANTKYECIYVQNIYINKS